MFRDNNRGWTYGTTYNVTCNRPDYVLSAFVWWVAYTRCSDEIMTIVAMLSVQNVFYRPKDQNVNFFKITNKYRLIVGIINSANIIRNVQKQAMSYVLFYFYMYSAYLLYFVGFGPF